MLATKDEDGFVRGNARSLARIANVSQESVNAALLLFASPDPDSNTPDHDGRRIAVVPGGWHVLNHALYRCRDYKEYERERKQAWREKMSGTCPGQVTDPSASVSASVSASEHQEGDARGESDKGDLYTSPLKVGFDEFWSAYPKKVGKKAAVKAWAKATDKPGVQEVIGKINELKSTKEWQKDGGQFIPHPATWLNEGRWDDAVKVDVKRSVTAETFVEYAQ
jgi:hypothetical protein